MELRLSKEIVEILVFTREEALRTGWAEATPDHAALGLLRKRSCRAVKLMSDLGCPIDAIKEKLDALIDKGGSIPYVEGKVVAFSGGFEEIFKAMMDQVMILRDERPDSVHLLLALLAVAKSDFARLMHDAGCGFNAVEYEVVRRKAAGEDDINTSDDIAASIHIAKVKCKIMDEDEPDGNERGNEKDEEAEEEGPHSGRDLFGQEGRPTALDLYSHDLTAAAASGDLDPTVGRDTEITRVEEILCRRKKNNPILIGEPGVGKTAIVEGLAQRIVSGNIPLPLAYKRILSLDMASIVAGTKYRGQFEERMQAIINEAEESPEVILYIDEIHTIIGAGNAGGTLDAANILKPALSRGHIQCIGSTTLNEFRETIESDGALDRRFQKVIVTPTGYEETLDILKAIAPYYEEHHCVTYTESALRACVTLSNRYITDREQPDKAIDLLDEAGAGTHLKAASPNRKSLQLHSRLGETMSARKEAEENKDTVKAEELHKAEMEIVDAISDMLTKCEEKLQKKPVTITEEVIAAAMSSISGIPLSKVAMSEGNRLLKMGEALKREVVGQDEAVEKVVKAIQRNRAGLRDPGKPVGTFLFLGPTGVGKTFLAKKLAEYMFDSADNFIRIDMSEYMEKFNVSRLIGAPPGYVGYGEGGQLTEKVRRTPYSVVLLDEIEKAHPDIFNLLLQVFDEGRLTDSNGRQIDFKNTILIMTSNVGSRDLKEFGNGIGYGADDSRETESRRIITKALSKTFPPEFLNRLDDHIYFRQLGKDDLGRIIDAEIKSLRTRITNAGYILKISPQAKKFIAEKGFDPQFGARPLKRAVQTYIEDPVTETILSGLPVGSTFTIMLNREKNGTYCSLNLETVTK